MKVYRQWVPCECNSSYNFIPIFFKLCTYFLHGLEMCMWFGYNSWINFCHFFYFVNFVIFWPQILWKCIDSGYLVSTTPYTISCLSLCNFTHLFFHGLKMCIWFGFNPAVNFCHFSTLLTLSLFNFSQMRHQLHRTSIYISAPILNNFMVTTELASLFDERLVWLQDPGWILGHD